jgi:acyl transferase domain-containing protein/NAD(P)H-dependent flavin oxidoreductase YrpB (nitropropane dioxygenase family)/NAD(P)-dependent dehydrogenase (short-subunit alcohol dehydrogenase family)/acyl carrier protein
MTSRPSNPILSFVWRPVEITPSVVDMARETSTGAIFEIDADHTADTAKALKNTGAKDIKITAEYFMDPELDSWLQGTGVEALWVEYNPALTACTPEAFIERLREFSDRFKCIPISGDLDFLTLTLQSEWHPPVIALKGVEAAGFVSTETAGVLYSTMREMMSHNARMPGLIIWGGVATPQAAAAFLCTGAEGIVFESLHWQTDLVSANRNLRQRLSKLRPEHTAVVGQNLGVSCRFFDKGNSAAVRELKQFVDSMFPCEVTDRERRAFALRVNERAISALESEMGRQDLILLGPEAAFAEAFAEQYGRSTRQALNTYIKDVLNICREAPNKLDGFVQNSAAGSLGTRFPFIQGAMSWISDKPEFALAVSGAGGLPTIALGLKNRKELEQDLGNLKEVMGENPYALNFIALPENPHLEQQLAWIEQHHPPFAVIAAGEPSYATRLQELGIQAIYVASSGGLIRLALEAGVRFIVLEGNEAGGHVGEHTTLTLVQIALALRQRAPGLFRDRYLVLAGGIYNKETAFRAIMLGADAVQMGTAYLATREIVTTGALSPLYQRLIVGSRPGMTTLSGHSIGLRVRSLKTPTMDAICNLEKEWASGQYDEISFRRRLEALSANSLLIAARGTKSPGDHVMDEETCMREGQFMSGAISGVVNHVLTLADFHRNLAEGPLELTLPERNERPVPTVTPRAGSSTNGNRVAITAMALVNSLGNTPGESWEASQALKSGITRVPPSRWDHDLYYDPDPRARGKTYCNVGSFQNINISRKELGIAPQDFHSMSGSTKLTLWLAENVISQSGLLDSGIPRERIGVLISQNSGEAAATITDLVFDVYSHDIIQSMRALFPVTPELEKATNEKIREGRLTVDDTTLLGRLNCAAGGFICNKYGFQGPSYSVSAACATSLVALYSAIQMIRNGIIDAAVVGGGEELLQPSHYLEFSALKALAHLSGKERPVRESSCPFDAARDGMVLGEGGGMIVIEKESVAKTRGVPVHAFITGVGASNNDSGMVEPSAETQTIAIRASFLDAGYGPDLVDLVECHATSTVHGDIEEVKALKTLFKSSSRTMLSSFKAQIGHTLGASGINSLIRGVTAMQEGVFPPTLNYRTPDPEINLEAEGFHVPVQPFEWPRSQDRPRHLEVNAFGFGGANYVVQLEECRGASGQVMTSVPLPEKTESHRPSDRERPAPVQGVSFFATHLAGQPYRIGVVAPSEAESRKKVEDLVPAASGRALSQKSLRVMARQGVFAAPDDRQVKPLAFVFAGQGSQYVGMSKELYQTFPEIRTWMDKIAAVPDFDLLDLLFNSKEEDLQKTRWQQPALYTVEFAMVQNLISMGVKPAAMAGHSLGELVALAIAGVFSYSDGFRIVNKRAQCMDKASGLRGDPGTMVAASAPMWYLEKKVVGLDSVYFTNFNSPRQIVLGGDTEPVLALMQEIKDAGYKATQLKVSMAFHSPIMKVIREEMSAFVSGISFDRPRIPVLSNTTMEPYPENPDRIREILMAHLESPVHWMQNARTLWDDFGVRYFVEIGPKDTLCNLVGETLEQALCVPTCMPEGEAHAYRAGIARLFALGHLQPDEIPFLKTTVRPERPSALPGIMGRAPSEDRVAAIVQREINAFVLESFGKIIKPQIVEAVRRESDSGFTEERLDRILATTSSPLPRAEIPESSAPTAPLPSLKAAPASLPSAPPPQKDVEEAIDYVEQVIRIIMNATGYERDEIEPDMDIRTDLAIRSSRLPVIMDEVEHKFDITINVEDFVDKRTVREIADCIEELAGRSGKRAPIGQAPVLRPPAPAADTADEPAVDEDVDYLEQVIRIIMDATGYDRDEIEPDMDIRTDLAIRSSRLPVIMDEVEGRFKITVNVEDFVDKRTVREIADCIEELAGRSGKPVPIEQAPVQPPPVPYADTEVKSTGDDFRQEESIKRLILEEVQLFAADSSPLTLEPGQEVAVLSTQPRSDLAADLTRLIEKRFGARTLLLDCLSRSEGGTFDLRTKAGAQNVAQRLKETKSLAGLVLVLEGGTESALAGPEDTATFLTGFFGCLKNLTSFKTKAFCLSLVRDVRPHTPEEVTAEGISGMFLAAALEYPSMLFRSMALDTGTDLKSALDFALDTGNPIIQLIYRDQKIFSIKASNEPLSLTKPGLELGAGDVIVISGGAKGVTYRIAKALAPFKVRVVLLGRTELDPAAAYSALGNLSGPAEKGIRRFFKKRKHGLKDDSETSKNLAGLDIARNVSRLSSLGLKVSYHCCDVADPRSVTRTLDQVVKQHGRIDGIIHGAGLIRDGFMEFMTPEDFKKVMDVKLVGAWNLYRAARDRGLRFFTGLSSIVAIQGNVGQANYCAANRSLSALLRSWADSHEGLVSKAFMLPPIKGTGMAEDPEVKELMKLKGLESAFVHADELAQMFCRELFLGPPQQSWVVLARTFPEVKGTLIKSTEPVKGDAGNSAGGLRFRDKDFPMIEIVDKLDLKNGEMVARRTFSQAYDLWLEDHKPFKFLRHPLVSGIMAVETFLEAGQLLYPHLSVLGVRRLQFLDILECPKNMEREARIICRRQAETGRVFRYEVELSSADISPSGRRLDRWSTNYRGEIILGPPSAYLTTWPDPPLTSDDFDTRPMEPHEIMDSYKIRTGLKGRYRVLERMLGTGTGVIKGDMVYHEQEDMAGLERVRYRYAPYLMEAMMHLFAFYVAIRPEEESWDLIPAGMEEMRFTRPVRDGECCTLEARLRSRDDQGFTWDARAVDESGITIMQVSSMRMNRFNQ